MTVSNNVSYIQLGRLVIMQLNQLVVSAAMSLDAPQPTTQMAFTARNVDNGDLVQFWASSDGHGKFSLQVFKATQYTQGSRYSADFVYITSNSS